jgi:hypothetical protein
MSQIEMIGGKNAIIFVQKLMSSLRAEKAITQSSATCVALHRFAYARNDGVRRRKIDKIPPCHHGR